MAKTVLIIALWMCGSYSAWAKSGVMNGYRFSDYAGFENKWHFVTVRYRKDSGEMRLVYANDLAWETLISGKHDYPDGAIFGKVAIATQEDPVFASSAVPSGSRRYQLMVKNLKKHKDDDGWGYALFDEKGIMFPGNETMQVKACAACHHIVPDRGYVFSELMPISLTTKRSSIVKDTLSRLRFRTVRRSSLPQSVRAHLPKSAKKIDIIMNSPMTKFLFQGTLDEIRPTLSKRAQKYKRPAALLSDDHKMFSLILPVSNGSLCVKNEMASFISTGSAVDPVRKLSFCYER